MRQWIELQPPLPVETTKGFGYATHILDLGFEHNTQWHVCLNEGPHAGEFWIIDNKDIRACLNWTTGRKRGTELKRDR